MNCWLLMQILELETVHIKVPLQAPKQCAYPAHTLGVATSTATEEVNSERLHTQREGIPDSLNEVRLHRTRHHHRTVEAGTRNKFRSPRTLR